MQSPGRQKQGMSLLVGVLCVTSHTYGYYITGTRKPMLPTPGIDVYAGAFLVKPLLDADSRYLEENGFEIQKKRPAFGRKYACEPLSTTLLKRKVLYGLGRISGLVRPIALSASIAPQHTMNLLCHAAANGSSAVHAN